MRKVLYALLTYLSFFSNSSWAGNIFLGTPDSRVAASEDGTAREVLSQNQSKEYRCEIEVKGDKYYWKSRGMTPLVMSQSGIYRNFVAVNGAGHIKIHEEVNGIKYMETLAYGLTTFTYFGTGILGYQFPR